VKNRQRTHNADQALREFSVFEADPLPPSGTERSDGIDSSFGGDISTLTGTTFSDEL
jgi:hypothetical protein